MAISAKCTVDGVEVVLSLDDPPQVNHIIEINGRRRKIIRVVKNQFRFEVGNQLMSEP
jgi:hypothetical protein